MIHEYTVERRQALTATEQEFADTVGWPVYRGELQWQGLLYQTALYNTQRQAEKGLDHLGKRLYGDQPRLATTVEVRLYRDPAGLVTRQGPREGEYKDRQVVTVHPDGRIELSEVERERGE